MRNTAPTVGFILAYVLMSAHGLTSASAQSTSDDQRQTLELDDQRVNESSGLAISNRTANRLWTHNDSGGKPQLYCFDTNGKRKGKCDLPSIRPNDWEDMASFVDDGVARLLVADCGDNNSRHSSIELHLFDEPKTDKSTTIQTETIQTIRVRYSDGPRDCEAVAVDSTRRIIVLIGKSRFGIAGVYTLPLPRRDEPKTIRQTAKRIGSIPIPMITAADFNAASGDLWVINYFIAVEFPCETRDEPLSSQIPRMGRKLELPRFRQIEAMAIDSNQGMWVTSEGVPAPLAKLNVAKAESGFGSK